MQFSDANKGGDGDDPNQNMGSTARNFLHHVVLAGRMARRSYWIVDEFKKEKTLMVKLTHVLRYTLFYPALVADFGDKVYGRNWEWGAMKPGSENIA